MSSQSGQGWGQDFYDCVVNNDLAKMEQLVEQHKIDLNAKFTEVIYFLLLVEKNVTLH